MCPHPALFPWRLCQTHLIGHLPSSRLVRGDCRVLIGPFRWLWGGLLLHGCCTLMAHGFLQQAALILSLTLYGCHAVSDRLGNQLIICLTHETQHHLRYRQRETGETR